jgi:hypothetical protein
MGDGGIREDVGDVVVGRDGRPVDDRGDGWRWEEVGEGIDGDPDESVDDLKGCTGLILGRRIGRGDGADGRSLLGSAEVKKVSSK